MTYNHILWVETLSYYNFISCLIASMVILIPFFPYVLSSMLSEFVPGFAEIGFLDPFLALLISLILSLILTVVFYRIAINNARELLTKSEL